MNYTFNLFKEKIDNTDELARFIKENNNIISDEEINTKISLIKQLLGYYNQLLIRAQDLLTEQDFNEQLNLQKENSLSLENIEKENNSQDKLEKLTKIYDNLNNNYVLITNRILNIIKNNNIITEYNNLIAKANKCITELNKLNLSNSVVEEILPLYNDVEKYKTTDKIKTFINKANNILLTNNNTNINESKGPTTERVFSLFAKINDQIIDSSYLTVDNLVYALYILEDKSKYYAIIKDSSQIEILNQSFSNLPNLILTKDNIIETCKIIIKNAGIYYDINEYMRYIEKSYKTKMTKEIDDLILKYKTRLQELENNIKIQLNFIDDISLLVNHKPCEKYPNITYNDVDINTYFPNYHEEKDSKLKEVERLIIEVLLNPNVKSEFNTKDILKTLYNNNIIASLLSSNYHKENYTPDINTSDNINSELEITSNIKTNYEKINEYLNTRLEELKLLESSPKINVTITKNDNSIYKDINTVLDLNTAISICDKVYKKGQGNYAVLDYLKTGNTLKFTSKYKARDLARSVNRNNYLKLLLENIFKRYLYSNNNSDLNSFVEAILSKDNINIKDIVKSLLENEKVLDYSITSFDYEYLNNISEKTKKIDQILNNNIDPKIEKINNILEEIKRTDTLVDTN